MAILSKGYSSNRPLDYHEYPWGDCITGTKAQLQNLGVGFGQAFPGEPGGPKRAMSVIDPRGFKASITRHWDGPLYCAHIKFPGRVRPSCEWQPFAAGVQRASCGHWDYFRGTAPALVAAGLIAAHQFPGMPGMRKVRVTILADGTVPQSAQAANRGRGTGTRTVEAKGAGTYRVAIRVDPDLAKRRLTAERAEDVRWEAQMLALPRPPRLQPMGAGLVQRWGSPPVQTAQGCSSVPLFDLNPPEAKAKEGYANRATKTLRELVDFSQERVDLNGRQD